MVPIIKNLGKITLSAGAGAPVMVAQVGEPRVSSKLTKFVAVAGWWRVGGGCWRCPTVLNGADGAQ